MTAPFVFRAIWPITDPTIPLDDLVREAVVDLPRLISQARALPLDAGRWRIVESVNVPGSGRLTDWTLVFDCRAREARLSTRAAVAAVLAAAGPTVAKPVRPRVGRRDALLDLDAEGVGLADACSRLKVSREALCTWARRYGMSDVYFRLAERDETPAGPTASAPLLEAAAS